MVRKKKKLDGFAVASSVVVGIYCLTLLYPMCWAIVMSLKTPGEYLLDKISFPKMLEFRNYAKAFKDLSTGDANLFVMFLNSLWYSSGVAIVQFLSLSIVGYILANYENWYTKFIIVLSTIVMIIPLVNNLAGQFKTSKMLGFYDSPLTILSNLSSIGFGALLSRAIMRGVDRVYIEAAYVEGANHLQIPFKFIIPQLAGYYFATGVMTFIHVWNDAESVLMFLPSYPTVMSGLYTYQVMATRMLNYPLLYAGLLMGSVPLIVLFIIFYRRLTEISIAGVLK